MIEVKGLYKDFGALHVLRGVSLNVEQGDIISIIGPSGSGKSTLLRSINLLEKPTYGEIWVEGKLITPPDPYLHWDVIRASKTYGELRAQGMEDELAIMKIKKEDLLKLLLDGGDAAWVLAFYHVVNFLRKRKGFLLHDLIIFDNIDGDIMVDET